MAKPGGIYEFIDLPQPLILVKSSDSVRNSLPWALSEIGLDLFNNQSFKLLYQHDFAWNLRVPIGDTNDLYWVPGFSFIIVLIGILLLSRNIKNKID